MVKLYYHYYFFKSLLFYIPVLILYLNFYIVAPEKVTFILSVKTFSVFLLEIPLGYLSDKLGRKKNLYLSLIFNMIFLLILIFKPSFYWLIVAEIFYSVSESLSSGTDISLIYDNLKYENKEKFFSEIQRNLSWYNSLALAFSFFAGSYLYSINKKSSFILTLIGTVITTIILLKIKEYPYKKSELTEEKSSYINLIISDIQKIKKEKDELKFMLLYSTIIISIFMSIYFYLFPLELNTLFSNKIFYGIIYCVGVLIVGMGGKCQKYVDNSENFVFYGVKYLIPFFLLVYIYKRSFIIVGFIIIMRFFWGTYSTNVNIEINSKISNSEIRTTILSIKNGVLNLLLSVLFFVFGILKNQEIENYQIIFGLGLIILLLFYIAYIRNNKNEISK